MEAIFSANSKTGDIVTKVPATSSVLQKYKIDFCCGGDRPIGEAIREKQLNESEVLEELNQVYFNTQAEDHTNWEEASYTELIDHIVNKHHSYLNTVLPELSTYTTKVLRVHGQNHPELADVHRLFHTLKADLEQHTIQEDTNTFPLIQEFAKKPTAKIAGSLAHELQDLEEEHEASGAILKELREVTNDYAIPEGACRTYQLTYHKLEELESDLFQHIHLENNILFPRVLQNVQ